MNAADLCDRLTLEEKLDLLTGPRPVDLGRSAHVGGSVNGR